MYLLFATMISLAAAAPSEIETSPASLIQQNMDSSADPCYNFYQFTCGKFVEQTIIPDDVETAGTFHDIEAKIEDQLQIIIADVIKQDDPLALKLAKTYYQTCMNTEQIEKNSEKDLREDLKKLGGCPLLEGQSWNENNFDWIKSMYKSSKMGYSTNIFVRVDIDVDPNNSNKRIIMIDQAETEVPNEYLQNGKDDDIVKATAQGFVDFVAFLGADKQDAEKEIDSFVNFEFDLAKISLSYDESLDATKLNNRITLKQLETKYPAIPWTAYINKILAPSANIDQHEEIIVAVPSFLEGLPKLIAKTPKRVLANYVCLRAISETINNMGEGLLNIVHKANIPFTGVEKQKQREKVCMKSVSNYFDTALGQIYVKQYFDKSTKTEVASIVENLRMSLGRMIEQADWMDDKTKTAALKKVRSVKSYIAYPDGLDNDVKINDFYQNLMLHPESFLRSEMTMKKFLKKQKYANLRKPINETSSMDYGDAATMNPIYYHAQNSFGLPAGILQGHFYSRNRPNYMNYGAVGTIIGNILNSAFDSVGIQYDENGNLANWWKNETKEKYLEKAKCFVEQYSNYTVKEVDMKIDGFYTQNENIADNVGLKAAYLAYNEWAKTNSKEAQLPGLNYTPLQMFWISFANNWCIKYQPEKLQMNLEADSHAPGEFRVIGSLSNMPEFSRDFACAAGSPMNPTKKCSLW